MTRFFIPILLILLSLGACNADDPMGPKPFSIFDVYGIWKLQMDDPGCGPGELFYLDFGPFGVTPTQDSLKISGSWYAAEKNPDVFKLTGHIYRDSGLAYFSLDILHTEIIEGIFVSNTNFSGAYREADGCTNRLQGKFIE